MSSLLENVRRVSVADSSCTSEALTALLKQLKVTSSSSNELQGVLQIVTSFEVDEMCYTDEEWTQISGELQKLNVRRGTVRYESLISAPLHVSRMRPCGHSCEHTQCRVSHSGWSAGSLTGSGHGQFLIEIIKYLDRRSFQTGSSPLVTVRILAAQDLDFDGWGDSPADTFLNILIVSSFCSFENIIPSRNVSLVSRFSSSTGTWLIQLCR